MSVLNANCLAIYFHGSGSENKYTVLNDYDSITEAESGVSTDVSDNLIVATDNSTFLGFGSIVAATDTFTETALTLAAAATTSTIDFSNTVEDVARDGSGGTLQQSDNSWTVSCDGLVKATNDTGEDFLDLARDGKYVIVKFDVDDLSYVGQALIDNVSITGNVDEIATYSVSLTGIDELYKA